MGDQDDIREVMASERSRGKSQPISTEKLELERQQRRIVAALLDKNKTIRDYQNVILEFGLEGKPELYEKYMKLWSEYRGA